MQNRLNILTSKDVFRNYFNGSIILFFSPNRYNSYSNLLSTLSFIFDSYKKASI